jgi:hypothetical protein
MTDFAHHCLMPVSTDCVIDIYTVVTTAALFYSKFSQMCHSVTNDVGITTKIRISGLQVGI